MTDHPTQDDPQRPDEPATGGLADALAVLGHLLREAGVAEEDIASATDNGTLYMLALERLIAIDPAIYTLEEVTEMSGLDTQSIRSYWRALGFPDPRLGEKLFSESDLEMLDSVLPYVEDGSLDPLLAVQMARVIGTSLARIATAQIEAIERSVSEQVEAMVDPDPDGSGASVADEDDLVGAAQRAAELLPMMPKLMEFVWRRHLGAAARRRIIRAAGETSIEGICIGFADLVGFTAQTQQLPEDELAAVVSRFETIAYDVVADHRGRVVKTIGDEVMYMADDARDGAEIAMDLAERYRADEALSDVRVGLALGRVLEKDGDVYGPVVNLAHRIVTVAYPGAVVVSPELREALADDPDFLFRSIRSHYLKDLGRIELWTLRRPSDADDPRDTRAQARKLARRQFMLERRIFRRREAAEHAEHEALAPDLHDALLEDAADPAEATTEEYEALADAVLEADIDPELQVELLTDIEAARRLHALEEEAQHRAEEADMEAERKLDEIEEEAHRRVHQVETEARIKVEATLQEAEEKARRANEDASRKVKRVAEDVERKADRAERDARREAKRKAGRRAAARSRTERKSAKNGDDGANGSTHADGPDGDDSSSDATPGD